MIRSYLLLIRNNKEKINDRIEGLSRIRSLMQKPAMVLLRFFTTQKSVTCISVLGLLVINYLGLRLLLKRAKMRT